MKLRVVGLWFGLTKVRKLSFSLQLTLLQLLNFHFMTDSQSHILEKLLEGPKLTSLIEPIEGQVCVIRHGSSCARVVIDKIFNDGRVGVHGLDKVIL